MTSRALMLTLRFTAANVSLRSRDVEAVASAALHGKDQAR